MRRVVVLCGPPGAGKSTAARASGLQVFDRDDARWSGEAHFTAALAKLATDRAAHAVVIRSAPTSLARLKAARLVGATHTFLMLADPDELRRRIRQRHRADMVRTLVGVDTWQSRFDRDDGCPEFPGWSALDPVNDPGVTSTQW